MRTPKGTKRVAVYGRTRAEAAKQAQGIAERDGKSHIAFDAGKITIGEYMERWLKWWFAERQPGHP